MRGGAAASGVRGGASGAAVGLLSIRRARKALLEPPDGTGATTVRGLLPAEAAPRLFPDDDLELALRRLGEHDLPEGLVLDRETFAPLGIVTRESILDAWRRSTGPSPQ
ncbi:MAG: hypothetical protein NVS4B10_17870 [Myxococcales bacterium]